MNEFQKVYQVTHLVLGVSFSRFEFTAISFGIGVDGGNGVDVSDEPENLPSKVLTTLSERTLDGLSVDM